MSDLFLCPSFFCSKLISLAYFSASVGHPGPGSLSPSIAALVSTHDLAGVSYSTAVRVQNNREEIIVDLEGMAVILIKKFFKKTKRKPERIVFYRDGVSEGQYAEVCRREIRALKREFDTVRDKGERKLMKRAMIRRMLPSRT